MPAAETEEVNLDSTPPLTAAFLTLPLHFHRLVDLVGPFATLGAIVRQGRWAGQSFAASASTRSH